MTKTVFESKEKDLAINSFLDKGQRRFQLTIQTLESFVQYDGKDLLLLLCEMQLALIKEMNFEG